ncbi:hypothetical protein CDO73_23810 [Saccharibacillus sp. O23]|uniref:hypothetical protein n=1 Tax=Saccharibacillus sp. O23 TaxID=2009338 RepID=UPI000B4E67C1|nr:hypothetical protein [Saccharibacillus sp. O23]OWR27270.1 hypothetical protein CDO73_23810 [Saccharibacillus sp. O23]
MGMDFTAYIGHSLTKYEIDKMCFDLNNNQLSHVDKFIKELRKVNSNDKQETWSIRVDEFGGTLELSGPYHLEFTFSEKVCMVSHYTRWITFLINDLEIDFQTHLRNISIELMEYFDAPYAIYCPDSAARESGIMDFLWEDENRDIDYIKEWLLRNCGEPKNTIKEIYKELDDCWKSDGYYIELRKSYIELTRSFNEASDIL